MPPQHVEVAETIAALKRAIRREKEGILAHTLELFSLREDGANPACSSSTHRPDYLFGDE
jgi:hypothetical protein